MITCKEDLIDTYVKDTPELREAFLSFAVKFGLIDSKSKFGESSEGAVVAYWHDATGDNPIVGCWFVYADRIKEECRELTLSDLKPTPTKFVKVEESIFDLKGELEHGELYCKNLCGSDDFVKLNTERALFGCAAAGNVYRQVEIDWREIVIELAPSGYGIKALGKNNLRIDGAYNKEQALILANAIIESLTEKPEGV